MNSVSWRKRFSVLLNRLYLYPAPESLPHTRRFWIAMSIVALAAALFSGFFIVYLTGLQSAYLTHAEDLGIMDQAMWNTVHGNLLHQTICNILNDTNCYNSQGIVRFAIHFEPILFLILPFYALFPSTNTLVILQTIVVACGAFPAFWLARLRLRNEWAAVAIALLYLFYPAQQEATFFDFHAVTLTAAFLLFVLYFMYTRRTVWMIVFAILAMGCKEEIPAVVAIYGLWSVIFQRRVKSGFALVGLGIVGTGVALYLTHVFSPLGHSLLAGRFSSLGNSPTQVALTLLKHPGADFRNYILEPNHLNYLRTLFAPSGFLALLAPWVLLLAVPTLGLNMLSSDAQMYSGMFQYNAEIVPVLIFATIEALVVILWLVNLLVARFQRPRTMPAESGTNVVLLSSEKQGRRSLAYVLHIALLVLLSCYLLINVVRIDTLRGHMPFSSGFQWPQVTAHDALAQHFVDLIPQGASVSAQSSLAPHVSERKEIYMFPYGVGLYGSKKLADYVWVDVTSDIYPYFSSYYYIHDVKLLLINGNYGIVAAQDGYILLKHGLPSSGVSSYSLTRPGGMDPAFVLPNLPTQFCSFVQATPQDVRNPLNAVFTDPQQPGSSMSLVGFRINTLYQFSKSAGYMTVTTYWKVENPISQPLQPAVFLVGSDGKDYLVSTDFPASFWCQTNIWKPGAIMALTTRVFGLQASNIPTGVAKMAIALVPMIQSSDTMSYIRKSLPAHVASGAAQVVSTKTATMVEIAPLQIIP